jgi:hypothetical protein
VWDHGSCGCGGQHHATSRKEGRAVGPLAPCREQLQPDRRRPTHLPMHRSEWFAVGGLRLDVCGQWLAAHLPRQE